MITTTISADKAGPRPIVTVVDGDAVVRDALASLIRAAGWIARTFASACEFLESPRFPVPGCLVLDVELPDLTGLELQRRIADRPEMPVIFVARQADILTTVKAMKAGAFEFMTRPFAEDALLSAIGSGIEHSRAVLSREAELLEIRNRHASLTTREREVMALVIQGLLNKQIGGELGIAEITVKAHRAKMMRKMKAHTIAKLVTIAAGLSLSPALAIHPKLSVDTMVRSSLAAGMPSLSA